MGHIGPRANFACRTCSQKAKQPFILEDLPVGAVRCPICGHKRGFQRLYDGINVGSSDARKIDKVLDKTMTPYLDRQSGIKAGATRFANASEAAMDRSLHEATPQQREQSKKLSGQVMPAAAALGAIPQASRIDSREAIYPALTNKHVKPVY